MIRVATRLKGSRSLKGLTALALVLGVATTPLAVLLDATPAGAQSTSYSPGAPVVDSISSPSSCTGTSCAPWNTSQGDTAASPYQSSDLFPTYTPGGNSTTGGYPNVAVYPGSTSGTDGNSPYPSGTVGTPGPLDDYCGSGNQAAESQPPSSTSVSRQPSGTTLPFAPYYFPHVAKNGDGSLTGYFDYRPKDGNEAVVAASSAASSQGSAWTYAGEALQENPGYCPSADVNDDGQGHANALTIGGSSYLYTLQRAAGDNAGVGMLAHSLSGATPSNPLGGLPPTEPVGIDPNAFATAPASVPTTGGTAVPIPLSQTGATGSPEQLFAGEFVDLTQTPQPTASSVISCTGVTSGSGLTGCTTPATSGISVQTGDLIEQVIGTVMTGTGSHPNVSPVPTGPNTTTGDGGAASIAINFATQTTAAILNSNAPNRLYLDGTAIYCSQANALPTTRIENCTTGPGGPSLTYALGDPLTSDPVVPAPQSGYAAPQQTNGLLSPDGIVGTLPSYPGTPAGATDVMYTEKILNYYIAGEGTASGSTAFNAASTINFFAGSSFSADMPSTVSASSPVTVNIADNTLAGAATPSYVFVPVTCTGLTTGPVTTGIQTENLTGCTVPTSISGTSYKNTDKFASNSYIAAPGAALVPYTTLNLTGEGSTSAQKLFKNNEDLTVLRVAYTTDGINFSSTGLTNGGIISGAGSEGGSTYDDISNPAQTTSPSNLNAYGTAGTALATEMRYIGSAGSIIVNPDGSYGLFLSGAWAADGDSDAFNQIFYSSSTDGEHWSVPTDVISTDYTFSASSAQDTALSSGHDDPLGVSAYYSGRAYGPSVVQNADGTLTMVFAGYRLPKPITSAGTVIGTNGSDQYTVGADDPALYRNIMTTTLTSSTSPAVPTQTSLAPVTSPVVVGQAQTLSATVSPVSPGTGTPTGTVTFSGSAGTLCTATLDESSPDTASCSYTYTAPSASPDSVSASYGGDNNYATSSSTPQSITVNQDGTSTSSPTASNGGNSANPAVVGEQITFSSTVAVVSPGTGPPTGSVTFTDASGELCSGSLSASSPYTASCTYAYTSPQSGDAVTAAYSGDTINAPSLSDALTEVINVAPTSTSVSASPQNPVVGQSVTLSATVGVTAPGAATPSGSVTFDGNGAAACTGTLDGGTPDVASCTTSYPAATTGTVTGTYGGDGNTAGSSGSTQVAVSPAATTTTASASPPNPKVGQNVTLSATVTAQPPGGGTATGTVTFSDPDGTLCSATLGQGTPDTATCAAAFNGVTAEQITATYGGDSNYTGSSGMANVTVVRGDSTTTLSSSANPSVTGQPITVTATVAPASPAAGVPTGNVTFELPSPISCQGGDTVALSNGTAKCTLTGLTPSVSPLNVGAVYSGSSTFTASNTTFQQVVDKANVQVTVNSSINPVGNEKAVTFSVSAAAASPGSGTPTGKFSWTITSASGATIPCRVSTSTVTCAVSSGKLVAADGPYTVNAAYGDDKNFTSGSGALTEAVSKSLTKFNLSVSVFASGGQASGTITAHVAGVSAPLALHPTGTVNFELTTSGGQSVSCTGGNTVTLPNSDTVSCKLAKAPLASFPSTVTVTYSGDGNFAPSTATKAIKS